MTVTVGLTATGLCIPAKGEHQEMSIFGPDYDKISGVEDAKRGLSKWNWGTDTIAIGNDTLESLLKQLSISAASVVIDQIERSFDVLFSPGDPPELTIWPVGLDNPEVTLSLARLVDEFIDTHIGDYDEEDVVAFSKWLRASADRVDANIGHSYLAGRNEK